MHSYDLKAMHKETRATIAKLLDDGSDPDALYIIEHHISHSNFDALEKLVVDLFKLGYEISDCHEYADDEGNLMFTCDVLSEAMLDPHIIDQQQQQMLPLIIKAQGFYDGWGTYFEDGSDDEEYDDAPLFH